MRFASAACSCTHPCTAAPILSTAIRAYGIPSTAHRHGTTRHLPRQEDKCYLGRFEKGAAREARRPEKERVPRTPPPPETSVEAAPEIAELIDAEADEAAKVLEAVVQQVVERGVAVPYETVEKPEEPKPEPAPEESQIERFDRLHASPLDRTDELLTQLRDASRDTNAVDVLSLIHI